MTSRPRHARRKESRRAQAVLRVGLTVTAAGAALAGAGGLAHAAEPSTVETPVGALDTSVVHEPQETLQYALEHSAGGALRPVADLPINPMAGTGSDPLDNGIGTQVADFKPIGTETVTGPLADGASLDELPVVQALGGMLRR
ncbi:hypothetical protein RM572_19315 [Streptomyces sp. DSM 42041]|uniref:ATP-binding protein n=1 Tax=Streptomyces hazeniae TaxID=3075538 RepID=A0ABU2NVA0_9ACTN|nr:hypothetical protein [Streptomyces sp. DSM 42041]MDT0380907.1 hypothetical protein [Streptomyces sp. DSM 42041]